MRMFPCLIVFDKEKKYPSFLEKNLSFFGENLLNRKGYFPQQGKDVPQQEKQAGRAFWGNLSKKTNSTFSTRTKSDVTQFVIV